jgi:CDP-diacylglycerol--glycerol-3-phosphate 3-phosphatidyltransferase
MKRENIWNIPNSLSVVRIIIAIVVIYMIFAQAGIIPIVVLFTIGMITDFFDGEIARKFKQKTEFGRKIDVIADRILLIGAMTAFVIEFSMRGIITPPKMLEIALVMTREIFCLPFALLLILSQKEMPKVRFVGKLTTFMQGISVTIVLLSIFYNLSFSIYFAAATAIIGLISAIYFMKDSLKETQK